MLLLLFLQQMWLMNDLSKKNKNKIILNEYLTTSCIILWSPNNIQFEVSLQWWVSCKSFCVEVAVVDVIVVFIIIVIVDAAVVVIVVVSIMYSGNIEWMKICNRCSQTTRTYNSTQRCSYNSYRYTDRMRFRYKHTHVCKLLHASKLHSVSWSLCWPILEIMVISIFFGFSLPKNGLN